jgi:hypothetical protein
MRNSKRGDDDSELCVYARTHDKNRKEPTR